MPALYESIITMAGGADNFASLGYCMTRLRFTLKDDAKMQADAFKSMPGILGFVRAVNLRRNTALI